jgi:hypothetical protein
MSKYVLIRKSKWKQIIEGMRKINVYILRKEVRNPYKQIKI